MTLVGPSLGAAVAIDFAVNFPEAVRVFSTSNLTTSLAVLEMYFVINAVCQICLFLLFVKA